MDDPNTNEERPPTAERDASSAEPHLGLEAGHTTSEGEGMSASGSTRTRPDDTNADGHEGLETGGATAAGKKMTASGTPTHEDESGEAGPASQPVKHE